MSNEKSYKLIKTGEAISKLVSTEGSCNPIKVIGVDSIRDSFEETCFKQAICGSKAPGVSEVILNPDAHVGYGVPVGSVLVSPSHIYPGPVGVDIKCSMSLLQLDIPEAEIRDKRVRRELIESILERIPVGMGKGQRSVPKSRPVDYELGKRVVTEGAASACDDLGIPNHWVNRCEDCIHTGHDGTGTSLLTRLEYLLDTNKYMKKFEEKMLQLGSYGGGNHFGECNIVHVEQNEKARNTASVFQLQDGKVSFLSHCGSRGFGHNLAANQFKILEENFEKWSIPFPSGDKHLVYAPVGTKEANDYLDDMALGSNFATVNHLLINSLVLEAFQQVLPGCTGELVYFISHNIARQEAYNNKLCWVHRKGATRAFPAKHHELKNTPFYDTGHPILLPGDPQRGSAVMVAEEGAKYSCYSVNHGAGRVMGRNQAERTLDQKQVDESFLAKDILTNCRQYPIDESPKVYKDFGNVIESVEKAGLASKVALLKSKFVIKDA